MNKRAVLAFPLLLVMLCLSLFIASCSDATSTPASIISTGVATTAVAPTTIAPITTVAPATTGGSATAITTTPVRTVSNTNSPLELVRKIDISATVKVPTGMVIDKQGNLYVVDAKENRINKFDPNGKLLTQWGRPGTGEGEFNLGRGNQPLMFGGFIALDPAGNLYISDLVNHRIQKFDANGKFLTAWGSQGSGDGEFGLPAWVVLDSQNNLYVSDASIDLTATRIQKFDSNGKFLGSYKNPGSGDGQFDIGHVSLIDSQGNLYLSDVFNNRIQVFDSNWNFLRKFGSKGAGDGQFAEPSAEWFDSKGNLYVTDSNDAGIRIQVFSPTGKLVGQWDSSVIGEPAFHHMHGNTIDSSGNFYFNRYLDGAVVYVMRPKI